jgi:Uma2 family endonuclease
MGVPAKAYVTLEEYLAYERQSECRNEYWNGQIFAMYGGNSAHALIGGDLYVALHRQLDKEGCLVYGPDMRVRTSAGGIYTYPDASAVCGKPKFATRSEDTLLNPVLIAEILSPSTERYDCVGKFALCG